MTIPCVDPDHFKIDKGVLTPQPWMQLRRVDTATAASVSATLPVSGGAAKDISIHGATVAWTNNTPMQQYVYGMVTRGGCQITLQARSRAYLVMKHSGIVGTGSPPATVEVSRVGTGLSVGTAGLFANGAYGIARVLQPSITLPLLPQQAGMIRLMPGQRYTARVELRFVSDAWESNPIDGGNSATESRYISGDTRLDLFAIPAIT